MLVIARHVGEEIMIGEDIVIRVVGKVGGRVKLGITAPEGTQILRSGYAPKTVSEVENGG